jgi:hypothetical protein
MKPNSTIKHAERILISYRSYDLRKNYSRRAAIYEAVGVKSPPILKKVLSGRQRSYGFHRPEPVK